METIIIKRKVKKFDTLFPIIVSLFLIVFMWLMKGINLKLYLFMMSFSILLIYFQRYNAVNLTMYEETLEIDFYLLFQKVKLNYNQIDKIYWVNSGAYGGSYLKFIVKAKDKTYRFRVKIFDSEFIKFLENKTGKKIR